MGSRPRQWFLSAFNSNWSSWRLAAKVIAAVSSESGEIWSMFLQSIDTEELDPLLMQYVFESANSVTAPLHNSAAAELSQWTCSSLCASCPNSKVLTLTKNLACDACPIWVRRENVNSNSSIQAFTKQWITAVNRGGLFVVGDEFTFYSPKWKWKWEWETLSWQRNTSSITVMK